MQVAIRPPPGFTSAQFFFASSPHTFLSSAALARTAWHGAERSFTCDSMQALMRPSPGCTPAHWVLISAAHCFATALCAIELVAEIDNIATVARTVLNISVSPWSTLIGARPPYRGFSTKPCRFMAGESPAAVHQRSASGNKRTRGRWPHRSLLTYSGALPPQLTQRERIIRTPRLPDCCRGKVRKAIELGSDEIVLRQTSHL
jgi:hypothetical protein